MDWQRGGQNLSADSGLAAEVGQIGGEAVAEVDGGRGETAAKQRLSDGQAGLRE
jgi:general stress protein YciG